MPQWTNRPPQEQLALALPIRRCPTGGSIAALILSDDLVGCYTHYFNGRTTPCEPTDCTACNAGVSFRYHAYLACVSAANTETFLLEVTAQVAEQIARYRDANHTLRGHRIGLKRRGNHPNGRVTVALSPLDLNGRLLRPAPDVPRTLCHIWNIPYAAPTITHDAQRKPHLAIPPRSNNDPERYAPLPGQQELPLK